MWAVAALSFLFTYLFFFEYQPHFKRVHIPYDLHGYHYSLADYTFQALRAGRFPQWDPTIYCGLSFPGNTNAALFYPPTWIALAANLGRRVLSYQTMEDLVFAHVWLAFLLCYLWLRNKRLLELASLLGAAVFAFSGYVCQQLQHLGLIACYAWMPLGFWGIDESIEQRRWRPLWKVAAASSMCFLAGYVPTWFVFAVCLLAYSAWRWRALAGAVAALGASMVISMVQLLPSYYATALKYPEAKYGSGIQDPAYMVSYLLPNYFDFSIHAAGQRFDQYLYLGIPFLLGLPFAFRRWRELIPVCLMGSVVLVIATNPGGLVWGIVRHFSLLNQICRDWYFLAGLTLAAAPVAAIGLDSALRRKRRLRPAWLAGAVICVLLGWSLWQLERWFAGTLPTGCRSGVEMLVLLALSALAVYLLPAQKGRMGLCLAAALLMAVGVDYKVYGTSKRVNAAEGQAYPLLAPNSFYAMDDEVFGQGV
ncbi:MAG: YfhO family protein, partial [Acidobacteria bacterium]|nr:YfhO family protein [Acidobacteriota bacterium]